jgi:hypothetical protein
MKAAIVLGHSHLSAIVNALMPRPYEASAVEKSIQYHIFDTVRLGAGYQYSVTHPAEPGKYILNPDIRKMVAASVPQDREHVYISMFGGNAHNALNLLEHPRPFDFVLPERPDLMVPGAELVPFGYVKRIIHRLAEPYILNMLTLREAVSGAVYHIESPPPCGDNQYILDHLEGYFKDQATDPRIAPRELRYKLWRLHSNLIREACEACGVTFVPAPPGTQYEDGFLQSEGYGGDSTHAGPWYGDRVLRNFEQSIGAEYGGWAWLF